LFQVKGVKIAVVAFTKGLNGMSLLDGNEDCVNLLYKDYDTTYQKINTEGINAILDDIDREMPDLVVALVHWGSEFNDNVSSTQKSIVKLLQGRGVDAIIGTHPHYVQKLELNEQTGQFLAYSLGDFLPSAFDLKPVPDVHPVAGTEYSILLDLEITKFATTGETRITGYSYTPLFSVSTEDSLRVVRLENAMTAYESNHLDAVSKDIYDDMAYAKKRIEARVKNGS
jgi:poly-gamma-glutamate synthesis protein (capsule biosynthesis protein)